MPSYTIYGTTFSSALPFRFPLLAGNDPPSLSVNESRTLIPTENARVLDRIPEPYLTGAGIHTAFRLPDKDVLRCLGGDQMVIRPDEITYVHAGNHPVRRDFVEVRLLGSGFAWWLLSQGKLPLHAGGLVVDGEAIVLMATSGTGKSSLLCSLLAEGHALLSDDFVTAHGTPDGTIVAAPSYPQMRLWPETIERFIGAADRYPSVFEGGVKRRVPIGNPWGNFLEGTFPVTRIYLLERQESSAGRVQLHHISGHEGFIELLCAILLGSSFPVEDLQPTWAILKQITDKIPIYRLAYPTGWDRLQEVHRAVIQPEKIQNA